MRDIAPPPRHRYSGGPPVDPVSVGGGPKLGGEGRRRLRVLVCLLFVMGLLAVS